MLRRRLPLMAGLLMLAGLLIGLAVSCGDSKPAPKPDTRTNDIGVTDVPVDQPTAQVDVPVGDQPAWPDQSADTPTTLPDQYVSQQPFGCQNDIDCFGQKCCPTPWGVRLCAPSCEAQ